MISGLHEWPLIYEIVMKMGIGKKKILDAAKICIESNKLSLFETFDEIKDQSLVSDVLTYKTVDNMKKIKTCLDKYLRCCKKFIEIVQICGKDGQGHQSLRQSLRQSSNHEELLIIFNSVKKFCKNLVSKSYYILSPFFKNKGDEEKDDYKNQRMKKLDSFILSSSTEVSGGGNSVSFLDPTALDISILVRLTAKEITNLIETFTVETLLIDPYKK
jgi:hypothetical protein